MKPVTVRDASLKVAAASISDGRPAFADERHVQEVLDRYLDDDRGQRFQMGAVAGAALTASCVGSGVLGALGNSVPLLAGAHGIAAGTVLATAVGIATGLYCCKKFTENRERFMTSYLLATIAGFGSLIAAAAAQSAGLPAGLLVSLGVGLSATVAGGAVRAGQSARAVRDLEGLERELDTAIKFEGVVLRNAKASEKAQQPAGQVKVDDDSVTVGGIRIPKGASRS